MKVWPTLLYAACMTTTPSAMANDVPRDVPRIPFIVQGLRGDRLEVTFKDQHYDIPFKYISLRSSEPPPAGTKSNAFTAEAVLPDLLAPSEDKDHVLTKSIGWTHQLHVLVNFDAGNTRGGLSADLRTIRRNVVDKPDRDVFQLHELIGKYPYESESVFYSDDKTAVFRCHTKPGLVVKFLSCNHFENIYPDITVSLAFPYDHLKDWVKIHGWVKSLLRRT